MLKNANGKVSDFVSDHTKCGKLFFIEADNLDLDKTGNYLPLFADLQGAWTRSQVPERTECRLLRTKRCQ